MAWKQVNVEEQRKRFIIAIIDGLSITDACRQFDISRPTAYLWIDRFKEEGFSGLLNRSKVPHSNPKATSDIIENKIIEMKLKYCKFGADKILIKLYEMDPFEKWPCSATIGNILKRNGLVVRRKLRKKVFANVPNPFNGDNPNDVWSMDFKGALRTREKSICSPFTLADTCTRFLIKCHILTRNDLLHVWGSLDAAFREFGLPKYLLSDNGPPFASLGIGRLSRLSINLIKAGVKPLWIKPGKPQQNGRHERMHGTMEYELGNPAANTVSELKTKLIVFQNQYNFERPHAGLNQLYPGTVYQPSQRSWDGHLRSPEYNENYDVRIVHKDGTITVKGNRIFVGEVLSKEPLGLKEDGKQLKVFYGDICLGHITEKNKIEFQILR